MVSARAEWALTELLLPSFVYMIEPIDDWTGWMDKAALLSSVFFEDFVEPPPALTISERIKHDIERGRGVLSVFEQRAFSMARTAGWEGDIRQGPYFSALPPASHDNHCYAAIMMAFKQDNNGQTFIATPYALPWIEHDALNIAVYNFNPAP